MRLAALAIGLVLGLRVAATGAEFYVAPDGRDTNPGTRSKPFATLERARDAIRALTSSGLPKLVEGAGGATVWIRGGTYRLTATFELSRADSGSKDFPVVYRACPGETVYLTGGVEVTGFSPVRDPKVLERLDPAARPHVRQADLKAQGITDFGKLTPRGFGRGSQPAALELYCDGKPMTLARWPNNAWAAIAAVPAGKDSGKFSYSGDRPARWADTADIWLHGYWTYPWAESYVKVASINTRTREITTAEPHGCYGYSEGRRYYALNILEELDSPGEYYLDRSTGILYFWPPGKGKVIATMLEKPLVSLTDCSYVTMRGLTFEYVRGTAIVISGGKSNRIAGCRIRNVGNTAVRIDGGADNGVIGCDIACTGDGAVSLQGGDRKTLTPAGNFVVNCSISDFSRWVRTYTPGIAVNGVGNRVAHNRIFDAPHSAIILGGNDHVIEFNEIFRVCQETGDAGAFYMGRDWTQRGNVVRFNYFHDLAKTEGLQGYSEVISVYLDDWSSGTRVYGNVCVKAGQGVHLGGGRDNVIANNVYVNCALGVHIDARGLGWARYYFDGTDNTLFDRFAAVNADKPPYSTRYPQLATLLSDEPALPKGNIVAHNICIGSKWLEISNDFDHSILDIRDNLVKEVAPLSSAEAADDALARAAAAANAPFAEALKLGFKRIPMDRIGTYVDEYRSQLAQQHPLSSVQEEKMADQTRYKDCYFAREGDLVTLGNSRIERAWRIDRTGLGTVRFLDKRTGRDWAVKKSFESRLTTDSGLIGLGEMAVVDVTSEIVQTPVSEPCLRVRFALEGDGLAVWKCFDIYPGAPAIRAWVEARSDLDRSNFDYTQVESLGLDLRRARASCVELHDLTDATNNLVTVREADLTEARRMVGNYLFVETDGGDGVFAYKESPVPNSQLYRLYYDFELTHTGISGIGAGFHNLPARQVRRTYAFTIGVYTGGRDGGILALKEYQKARYKLVPERDYIISANSWGAYHTDIDEAKMIAEVETAAQLGITTVAVDAGWTRSVMGGEPNPETFPDGFERLTTRAKELGVELELWTIPNRLDDRLDVLKEHPDWIARTNNLVPCDVWHSYFDTRLVGIDLCHPDCFAWMRDYYLRLYDMGFERFKIDTFQCDRYDTLLGDLYDHYEALRRLMEELVTLRPGLTFTQDSTRTNRPIYDYYMDYGIIFLENRYMDRPADAIGRYHPWKTLRNLWQIAPYIPPQKLNMELINDQEGYSPEYLLATVMMANPLFWEALAGVSEQSRNALKPAIALYRQHQAAIYEGCILPIGDMPDGTSWTGFQSHNPETGGGYLLVLREDNPKQSRRFYPKFVRTTTRFESVTDDSPALTCNASDEGVEVALPHPRAFRLYRYYVVR